MSNSANDICFQQFDFEIVLLVDSMMKVEICALPLYGDTFQSRKTWDYRCALCEAFALLFSLLLLLRRMIHFDSVRQQDE